jgi:hypothetical protein
MNQKAPYGETGSGKGKDKKKLEQAFKGNAHLFPDVALA